MKPRHLLRYAAGAVVLALAMIVAVPHLIVMRERTALGLCPFGAAPSMRRVILNDSPQVSPDDGAETASARSEQFFGLDVDGTHA
ncbi:MAG: hypothetical protein EOO40_11795, partial [Deltaproteobacteria bacterium]